MWAGTAPRPGAREPALERLGLGLGERGNFGPRDGFPPL
jgi:hypothetical protein